MERKVFHVQWDNFFLKLLMVIFTKLLGPEKGLRSTEFRKFVCLQSDSMSIGALGEKSLEFF